MRDIGVNEVLNTGLRVALNGTSWVKRPDGSSYGVQALTMPTAFGYIRLREYKHHWRDVIAGGALGYDVAMITVTPIERDMVYGCGGFRLGVRRPEADAHDHRLRVCRLRCF